MDEEAITNYLLDTCLLGNVECSDNMGYRFFFYGGDHRFPFATIALNGNEYEKVSQLDRPGVFRLNIGVRKQTFQNMFGSDELVMTNYDFAELDRFMPHPDYWKQFFVCILDPGPANVPTVKEMFAEAYAAAEERYKKRTPTAE